MWFDEAVEGDVHGYFERARGELRELRRRWQARARRSLLEHTIASVSARLAACRGALAPFAVASPTARAAARAGYLASLALVRLLDDAGFEGWVDDDALEPARDAVDDFMAEWAPYISDNDALLWRAILEAPTRARALAMLPRI